MSFTGGVHGELARVPQLQIQASIQSAVQHSSSFFEAHLYVAESALGEFFLSFVCPGPAAPGVTCQGQCACSKCKTGQVQVRKNVHYIASPSLLEHSAQFEFALGAVVPADHWGCCVQPNLQQNVSTGRVDAVYETSLSEGL